MKKTTELTLKRSIRARKAKKLITCITCGLCAGILMSMNVFAAGAVSTTEFINQACTVLTALLSLIGAGIGLWGFVNLLEGYGSDNAAGKSQGMKQLMSGIAIVMVGVVLVPVLKNMMSSATT